MEQQKYFGSLINYTRTFITTNYSKLPIKPPKFVEKIVGYADGLSKPYISSVSDIVDININKSIEVVQNYEKRVEAQSSKLKQRGKELKQQLNDQSKKVIDQSVDLAFKNNRIINTLDRMADTVFSSIERRVEQLQGVVNKGKNNQLIIDQSTYHKRVKSLALNITQLSKGLLQVVFQGEGKQIVAQRFIRIQHFIKQHSTATLHVIKLQFITPFTDLFHYSKDQFKGFIELLSTKYNNRELTQFIRETITIENGKNASSKLINTIFTINIISTIKRQTNNMINQYKEQLIQKQQVIEAQQEPAATVQQQNTTTTAQGSIEVQEQIEEVQAQQVEETIQNQNEEEKQDDEE